MDVDRPRIVAHLAQPRLEFDVRFQTPGLWARRVVTALLGLDIVYMAAFECNISDEMLDHRGKVSTRFRWLL